MCNDCELKKSFFLSIKNNNLKFFNKFLNEYINTKDYFDIYINGCNTILTWNFIEDFLEYIENKDINFHNVIEEDLYKLVKYNLYLMDFIYDLSKFIEETDSLERKSK